MIAFPKEWTAVFLLLLCDFVWALLIHFKLQIGLGDFALLGSALAIVAIFRGIFVQPRLALCAEGFALSISASAAFAVLTYLGCAANLPLVDKELLMIDRSLGFDWPGWYQVIVDSPVLAVVVVWIYNSMIYQGLYFSLLFGMMHRPDRLPSAKKLPLACRGPAQDNDAPDGLSA